jgi:leader peptidase (prepilin peptidase) / N-methyltransferase
MLGGRCRACGAKISLKYPLVELLTALLFVLFFLKFRLEKIYFFYIIITGYLIVLTFIDIDKKEVPDGAIVLLFLTGFVLCVLEMNGLTNVFAGIIGAITGGFIIYLIVFFTNGKIGEGDAKLMAALGLCLGLKGTLNLILGSFIIGGIVSLALLISGKYKRTDKVAFVPFIAAAFLVESLIL